MIEVLTELGRRMEAYAGKGHDDTTAARIVARDMLSGEALTAWLGRYPGVPVAVPRVVLVIMAGNIPFVGMHDLICVLASGHRAIVKPSSKDRENMEWVVTQLLDIDPRVPVSVTASTMLSITDGDFAPDAVIAMGSDTTVAAIAARYPAVPTLLRGNRSSLAVLTGGETDEELEGLADDVLMYSGLGCRNVSLVWVPRGYDFAALVEVLARRAEEVTAAFRNNYRQTRALLRMTGATHIDAGAVLLVESPDFPARPSILNYAPYDTPADVSAWIGRHDKEIQCVAAHNSRTVRLGQTQRPGLTDYPDGRDTMQFLAAL